MEEVDVEFTGGGATQVFRIGAPSCAVPGAVAGLEDAHRRFGTLPWAELIAPAAALARDGVELTAGQAYLHAILDSILARTPKAGRSSRPRGTGSRPATGSSCPTWPTPSTFWRARGLRPSTRASSAGASSGMFGRVAARSPATTCAPTASSGGGRSGPPSTGTSSSNPPPSSGGILIAYGLKLLDRLPPRPAGTAAAMAELVEILREQTRARQAWRPSDLYRGGLRDALLGERAIAAALDRIAKAPGVAEPREARGTTHISAVDRVGNAASLTISTGSGSGIVVPGTGIQLNNMLGEFDLNVTGAQAGTRLTSMMAPSIVVGPTGPRLVVGSAGSLRLRGAILQVVVNVVRHGMSVEDAIAFPRLHVDDQHVHLEGGADRAEADALEAAGYDLVRWRRRNLFFGGAAAVERQPDGELHAAGDPRRGGHGVVVEQGSLTGTVPVMSS